MDPGRGAVLAQLQQLATTKQAILADDSLSEEEKAEKVIATCSVRSVYCVICLVMRVTRPVEPARGSSVSREQWWASYFYKVAVPYWVKEHRLLLIRYSFFSVTVPL